LLNIQCPGHGCGLVVLNFIGCLALTCEYVDDGGVRRGGCGIGYCAVCLERCGNDAHAHVGDNHVDFPGKHGRYFAPEANVQEHWRKLKQQRVTDYLAAIADVGERQRALEACVVELRDLEIVVAL
jgi:hypothetical protein